MSALPPKADIEVAFDIIDIVLGKVLKLLGASP